MGKALRISIVTELSRLLGQLADRGHTVQLVRPMQAREANVPSLASKTLLVRGIPIPGYGKFSIGMPSGRPPERAQQAFISSTGHNGMLATVNDASEFNRHCASLFFNPGYLQTIRREARRSMERPSWDEVGAEFKRILRVHVSKEVCDESLQRLAKSFGTR